MVTGVRGGGERTENNACKIPLTAAALAAMSGHQVLIPLEHLVLPGAMLGTVS